jgi:hypothetical protein
MSLGWRLAPRHKHLEVPIGFLFCESRAPVQEKLCDALDLLASASHQYLKRLRQHIRGILIMPLGTAVGEFFPPLKLCCLDERHVSSESTLAEEIAATLIHETAHAHLYTLGIGYPSSLHLRIEKLCHRRELWFGKRIGSEVVCERAKEYLQQPDSFWAPEAQKTRWLNALKQYEISGWLERFFKYLIERRFA